MQIIILFWKYEARINIVFGINGVFVILLGFSDKLPR